MTTSNLLFLALLDTFFLVLWSEIRTQIQDYLAKTPTLALWSPGGNTPIMTAAAEMGLGRAAFQEACRLVAKQSHEIIQVYLISNLQHVSVIGWVKCWFSKVTTFAAAYGLGGGGIGIIKPEWVLLSRAQWSLLFGWMMVTTAGKLS